MAAASPLVPVIVGATATGKTALAAALAARWSIMVISADSRQVYRGLDVGTGKPAPDILRGVPHLGIDLVEPGERYSAGRFAREAAGWLGAHPGGRRPVVVGGTGLYVRALADGLFHEPPLDPGRRQRLAQWTARAERLGGWAARLDPGFSGGGRQRAARTVEVALLTGRPLSWWQREAKAEATMRPWYVWLTLPRARLHQRIAARVDTMLAAGWVEEVRQVLACGIPPGAPGLDAVGYREIVRHLQGKLEAARLPEAIIASTRRYAKRQETWFRHQLRGGPVVTLDASVTPADLARQVSERWERASG